MLDPVRFTKLISDELLLVTVGSELRLSEEARLDSNLFTILTKSESLPEVVITRAVFGAAGVGEIVEALDLLFWSLRILCVEGTLAMMLLTMWLG